MLLHVDVGQPFIKSRTEDSLMVTQCLWPTVYTDSIIKLVRNIVCTVVVRLVKFLLFQAVLSLLIAIGKWLSATVIENGVGNEQKQSACWLEIPSVCMTGH